MKQHFGWVGQILRVNLSTGNLTTESVDRYANRVLGGRGLGQFILFDELEPSVAPLSPGNKVVLSAGPLTGTLAPGSGRLSVDWKNPQTGGIGSANAGGQFAPELKYAGFDAIVIEGQSQEPVFLLIRDGQAHLLSASAIWGKTTWETEAILHQQLNDDKLRVASIGPAGENLVNGACLIVDYSRAAARGGVGAVLGAKKLKAIAVRGNGSVAVSNPNGFFKAVEECWSKLESSRAIQRYRTGGTLNTWQPVGVRNHQDYEWSPEKFAKVAWQALGDKFEVRKLSCFNCPAFCSHFLVVKDGPYAGTACEGLEANAARAFGSLLDNDCPEAIVKAHARCSELGLDVDFAGTTIGWAFESYQRGVVTTQDTGGLELVWGNHQAALKLLNQIAYRQGLGATLADGVKQAAETWGQGSDQWALHVKGAEVNESRWRTDRAWALGLTIANRGGGHLEGSVMTAAILNQLTPQKSQELFGVPDIGGVTEYTNKERVVFWYQKLKSVVDSLGLCYLLSAWNHLDTLEPEDYASLFVPATGVEISADDLMHIGQGISNIEKAFNTLHAGFTRDDDLPPIRFMTEPVKSGPFAGELAHKDKWNQMLDRYYQLHGWDPTTGQQTEAGLVALGLTDVAQRLKKYGKL
ncbi:aldehyde ferredoxin oxidoreductase family protein [Chloroflexota bacterium]